MVDTRKLIRESLHNRVVVFFGVLAIFYGVLYGRGALWGDFVDIAVLAFFLLP